MVYVKVYIAGKVSDNSFFGTHDWRENFCAKLAKLSGLNLENLDPLRFAGSSDKVEDIFAKDCYLISQGDAVVVYLSDDISVGGSQEILIAKYYAKPVIGLAPRGGKFNGNSRKIGGKSVEDYRDPFVFSTCDEVCDNIESVAESLVKFAGGGAKVKTLDIIAQAVEGFMEAQK